VFFLCFLIPNRSLGSIWPKALVQFTIQAYNLQDVDSRGYCYLLIGRSETIS
jgi:hypothetical protein